MGFALVLFLVFLLYQYYSPRALDERKSCNIGPWREYYFLVNRLVHSVEEFIKSSRTWDSYTIYVSLFAFMFFMMLSLYLMNMKNSYTLYCIRPNTIGVCVASCDSFKIKMSPNSYSYKLFIGYDFLEELYPYLYLVI